MIGTLTAPSHLAPGERVARGVAVGLTVAGWVLGSTATLLAAQLQDDPLDVVRPVGVASAAGAGDPRASGDRASEGPVSRGPDGGGSGAGHLSPDFGGGSAPPSAAIVPRSGKGGAGCPALLSLFFSVKGVRLDRSGLAPKMERLRVWVADHLGATLVLDGHSSSSGTEQYNLALSYRRAEAVARILRRSRIPADRIRVRGFGYYQPMLGVDGESHRNQRVDIGVRGVSTCPAPLDDRPGTEEGRSR